MTKFKQLSNIFLKIFYDKKQIAFLFFLFFKSYLFADTIAKAPNIVLILADDVALMDFGAYGGEASTPNIDMLAGKGTLFTNYHASPMCAPSRAMLLTGYDSQLTGVPNLPLFLPPEYAEKPGYKGILNNEVKTVATHLKEKGYRTYMTGKWHLGHTENTLPSKRGFDRTFILSASGADNWEQRPYLPTQSKPPWFENGKAIDLPKDFYSSRNLVDKMISFMGEFEEEENPFFAFLSFQAVHIPVQAPKEFTQKYEDVYSQGWDKLRVQRFEKAKQLGLVPANATLGNMLSVMNRWDDLSAEEKKYNAKRMAVNAGMLEAMDYHIGRYMEYLKKEGKFDNTIFIITSDNGPEASDPSLVAIMPLWLKMVGYSQEYETLGEKGSFVVIGPEFASAAASPSSFFKFYAGEGGLRVPLIMSGPGIPFAQQQKAFSFITDITPTIMELAGIDPVIATKPNPLTGRSLVPLMKQEATSVYGKDEYLGMEAAGQAALFKGDFKLVRNGKPYGDGIWRLYNLANDPGEVNDLTSTQPNLFKELMAAYKDYTMKNGVLEMPEGYETVKEIQNKLVRNLKKKSLPWLGVLGILVVVFIIRRRKKKQN